MEEVEREGLCDRMPKFPPRLENLHYSLVRDSLRLSFALVCIRDRLCWRNLFDRQFQRYT